LIGSPVHDPSSNARRAAATPLPMVCSPASATRAKTTSVLGSSRLAYSASAGTTQLPSMKTSSCSIIYPLGNV
jgi:hypothetical protein